jgi:hypothetical protein
MTDKLALLQDWEHVIRNVQEAADTLSEVIIIDTLDPFFEASSRFTAEISKQVNDSGDWLNWWVYDALFGQADVEMRTIHIQTEDGKKEVVVNSLQDLLEMIEL